MGKISEIESAVRELTPDELATFRQWFSEYDTRMWDCQIEDDITAGRLDALADEALQDFRQGRTEKL